MAIFNLRYYCEFRSKYENIQYRIDIEQRGFVGTPEEMHAADEPLIVVWERRGDDFSQAIKASEVTLKVLCYENFEYTRLFTADARQFRMTVFKDSKMYWRGFLCADTYSEAFESTPYYITLKAIDGFTLLDDIPFVDTNARKYKGRLSLMEIVTKCLDVLELDIPLEEWIGIRQLASSSNTLEDSYVDMPLVYATYEDLTYREALELCLQPFAAQIFQAQGVLHIRRVMSLMDTFRPNGFYINNPQRSTTEILWSNGAQVNGTTTMQINPALRSCQVSISNKKVVSIPERIGLFDINKWTTTGVGRFICGKDYIEFSRANSSAPRISHSGFAIDSTSTELTFGFSIFGNGSGPVAKFILKLQDSLSSLYFNGSSWQSEEYIFSVSGTKLPGTRGGSYSYDDVELKIPNIPINGSLVFIVLNTATSSSQYPTSNVLRLHDFDIKFDVDDVYETNLSVNEIISYGNNKKLEVKVPTSDIPVIPNNRIIYNLYLTNTDGQPTEIWIAGQNACSLVQHIINTARQLHAIPRRQLNGLFDCKNTVDLNTIIRDDVYTNCDYYLNYIELNALEDDLTVEMCEFRSVEPPLASGDDCIMVADTGVIPLACAKCSYKLFIYATDLNIYLFDTYSLKLEKTNISTSSIYNSVKLFESVGCVVVLQQNKCIAYDVNGRVISEILPHKYRPLNSNEMVDMKMISAVYSIERGWVTAESTGNSTLVYAEARIPDGYSRNESIFTSTTDDVRLIQYSVDSFIIITPTISTYYDYRVHGDFVPQTITPSDEILVISDKIILSSGESQLGFMPTQVSKRKGIELTTVNREGVYSSVDEAKVFDVNNDTAIAYFMPSHTMYIYKPYKQFSSIILNTAHQLKSVPDALKIINGIPYIVRGGKIYKYTFHQPTYIAILPEYINAPFYPGSTKVTVDSSGSWTATSDSDWLSVVCNGKDALISYVSNTGVNRTGNILFHTQGASTTLVVNQAGFSIIDHISLSQNFTTAECTSGSQEITILANGLWTTECGSEWLTITPSSGGPGNTTAVVSWSENGTYPRSEDIYFTRGNASTTFTVDQAERIEPLSIDPQSIQFIDLDDFSSLHIYTNESWTVTCPQDWLSIYPRSGNGNSTVSIACRQNPYDTYRSTQIYVSTDHYGEFCDVVQEGKYGITIKNTDSETESSVTVDTLDDEQEVNPPTV